MEAVVVVEWLAKVGDNLKAGDIVVVVETAKAATEIEAPASGVLSEIRADVGTEIEIGGLLGIIGDADAKRAAVPAAASVAAIDAPPPVASAPVILTPVKVEAVSDRIVASPLARRIAALNGIDLATVLATSPSGRIKVRDIEMTLKAAKPVAAPAVASRIVAEKAEGDASGQLYMQRRAGDGMPIVFLHGFGSDSLSWRPVLTALRSRNTTVSIDLPSHGRSPFMPIADVRALGAAVSAALEGEGLDQIHLVGHSLGGATALAIAEAGRIEIRSLTLISPAGLGAEIDGSFIDGFSRATRKESLEPWLRRLVADESLINPAFVSATMQSRENADLRDAQAELADRLFPDGTQAADFRQAFARLGMPQKIIWGIQDSIIPWKHALAGTGKAGLHLLPAIGHMPQFEAAGAVAAAIDELVRATA
ncbi:hypothetical protein ADU59_13340 [Pararhizobium polonicum]|uniref:Acetoin dehydrogenase dihydrolipoyllysine-residue acetyltransferase subunit n=2 Tax=Pararhizobium polonicum TaxID=1612624 RepID=A0A1C7P5U8_9HYPH|nr:hypothetical protein ADU59_13340 [Pararhizobium polonicum]